VLTTELPRRGSDGDVALRAAGRGACFDVIDLLDASALDRLAAYAGGDVDAPLAGFWTKKELEAGAGASP
jgi:hypothetical protein